MGIKSMSSNRKKSLKSRKSERWHRTLKAEKKKVLPAESVEIENVHLFSSQKLKNKLKNPKNNIKISGKKFRRLTKRLGHSVRERSQMDVEVVRTRGSQVRDAVMVEANSELIEAAAPVIPSASSSSFPTAAPKKKKRGGKKHKKGAATVADDDGQIFENNDGWEDVEMKDV